MRESASASHSHCDTTQWRAASNLVRTVASDLLDCSQSTRAAEVEALVSTPLRRRCPDPGSGHRVRQMRPSLRGDGRNLDCVSLWAESASSVATATGFRYGHGRPRDGGCGPPAALKSAAARPGKTCRASPERSEPLASRGAHLLGTGHSAPVNGNAVSDGVRGDFQPPGCEASPRCRVPHRQRCAHCPPRRVRARSRNVWSIRDGRGIGTL